MPDRAKSMAAGEPAHRAPATITSQSAKNHFPGARAPQGTQARAPRRQQPTAASSRSLERRDRRGEGRERPVSGIRWVTGGAGAWPGDARAVA